MGCTAARHTSPAPLIVTKVDNTVSGLRPVVLITERRGAFPTYRMNGVFQNVGQGQTAKGTHLYHRADRPEVCLEICCANECEENLGLRWLVDGTLIAYSCSANPGATSSQPTLMVRTPQGEFEQDGNLLAVSYPRNSFPHALRAAQNRHKAWSKKKRHEWQFCPLLDLEPPIEIVFGPNSNPFTKNLLFSAGNRYTLWGMSENANCLSDLVQGDIGNCGVLAAIDSLAHEDPLSTVGHMLEINAIGNVTEINASMFDPHNGKAAVWTIDTPVRPITNQADKGIRGFEIQVYSGTAVPRFARSMSDRAWGMALEAALADVAGGYPNLNESEPSTTWLTLLGAGTKVFKYIHGRTLSWQAFSANVRHDHGSRGQNPSGQVPSSKAWRRASMWGSAGAENKIENIETLISESCHAGDPLVVFPVGILKPHPERGEPFVTTEVYWGSHVNISHGDIYKAEYTRFLLGHAYSLRGCARAKPFWEERGVEELWVRLRDPRQLRVFWIPWRTVLRLAEDKCVVYRCIRPSQLAAAPQFV